MRWPEKWNPAPQEVVQSPRTSLLQPIKLAERLRESWELILGVTFVASITLTLGAMGLIQATGSFSPPMVGIEDGFKLLGATVAGYATIYSAVKTATFIKSRFLK